MSNITENLPSFDEKTRNLFIAIVSSVVVLMTIFYIYEAPYVQTYSGDISLTLLALSMVFYSISRFIISYKFSIFHNAGVAILLALSVYILSLGKDSSANWGIGLVMLALVFDTVFIFRASSLLKERVTSNAFIYPIIGSLLSFVFIGYCIF
mgnify:CR=1 FL=1